MNTVYICILLIFIFCVFSKYDKFTNIDNMINTNKCILNKITGYITQPNGPISQISFFNNKKLIYTEGIKTGKEFNIVCPKNQCITEFKYSNYKGSADKNIANIGSVKCNNKLSINKNLGPKEYLHTWNHENFFYKPNICKCLIDTQIDTVDEDSYLAINQFELLNKKIQNEQLKNNKLLGKNDEKPSKSRILVDNFNTSINYILGFMIKPIGLVKGKSNILHFTYQNSKGQFGNKNPSIFLDNFKLSVEQNSIQKLDNLISISNELKKDVYYFIELKVIKDEMKLFVNGILQKTINIEYTRYEQNNVKVYMSSPDSIASNVLISNIIYVKLNQKNGFYVKYFDKTLTNFIKNDTILNENINITSGLVYNSGLQNNIGLKIQGFIKPILTGSYKFRLKINDGAKLYINNKILIDSWKIQNGIIEYDSDASYHIKDLLFSFQIDWFNNNGPYSLVFYWLPPGYTNWQLIPKENFIISK